MFGSVKERRRATIIKSAVILWSASVRTRWGSCRGLQTVSDGLANRGGVQPTCCANELRGQT
jgi:hypothetical protein